MEGDDGNAGRRSIDEVKQLGIQPSDSPSIPVREASSLIPWDSSKFPIRFRFAEERALPSGGAVRK